MSAVFNILEEELERLQKLSSKYNKEIDNLPKGSLSLKKRYNKFFAYLSYRENKKVVSEYLGKPGSKQVKDILDKLAIKKDYLSKLKVVQDDIKKIKGVLHGRSV